MICPNCGAENAQGAPYCYNCANPLPQAGAGMPPGSVPPGSVPPGGIPTGGVPPGSVPPGGGYVPPGGGYSPGPIKPPKNTFSAGIAALIAFLVVAGIGVVLFLTVFHKKEEVAPPTPTPVTTTGPTGTTGGTTTGGTTTGGTTTGGTTTGGTTTGGTTTGGTTTGGTTTAPTKPPKSPKPTKPAPPPAVITFVPKFCLVPPTEVTFAGGCRSDLNVPTGRVFFFVIRTQNMPAGTVFSVSMVLEGTNRSVLDFDLPATNGQRVNRVFQAINPVPSAFQGITVVAVLKANGVNITCNGNPCSQADDASVTFT